MTLSVSGSLESRLERVLALRDAARVVAVQVPVTALNRLLHLVLRGAHASLDVLLKHGQ